MILEFESGKKFKAPFEIRTEKEGFEQHNEEELVQLRRATKVEALMPSVIKVDLEFISFFYIRYKCHSVKLNYLWRRIIPISLFGVLDHMKMVRVYQP